MPRGRVVRPDKLGESDQAEENIAPLVRHVPLVDTTALTAIGSGSEIRRSLAPNAVTIAQSASLSSLSSASPLAGLSASALRGAPAVSETTAERSSPSAPLEPSNGMMEKLRRLAQVFDNVPRSFVFVRPRRRAVAPPPPPPSPPPAMPGEPLNPMMARLLAATEDPGTQLPEEERTTFEPIIGTTLRDVRIHTGRTAKATAAALGAEAFTIGSDIFFRQGRYEPSTRRGQALLAHELAHVGQQTDPRRERPDEDQTGQKVEEAEAEAVERSVLAGTSNHVSSVTVGKYVRKYVASDGRPVSARDRERLDAISVSALEICEHLLGTIPGQVDEREIAGLQVDVRLDLASLTDAQAAEIWGRALADAIREKLGSVLPNSR